jgi:DNA modification methylase
MGRSVARAINSGNTEILKANSIKGAYDKLQAQSKLADRIALIKKNIPIEDQLKGLFNEDGTTWLSKLPNESLDLWFFDPPWGIGVDDYDRHHNYEEWDDSYDAARTIQQAMVPHLYRTLKPNSFLITFFGIQFYEEYKQLLESAGFFVQPVPHLWYKPDKKGAQSDASRNDINQYEPIFICRKGDPRIFKQAQGNVLIYPMPSRSDRIHYAQKSLDLIKDILERYSFGNMIVGDPTAGSLVVAKAAKALGRQYLVNERNKETFDQGVIYVNSFSS